MRTSLEQNNKLTSVFEAIFKQKVPNRSTRKIRKGNTSSKWFYCFTCKHKKHHVSRNCTALWKCNNHKADVTLEDNKGECKNRKHTYDKFKPKS